MFDKEYRHYAEFPVDLWKWPNFSPQELACRGDNTLMVNEHSMDCLQRLRGILGRPLIINSAYRSRPYNTRIGGAKGSKHMEALAFDVSMANHDPAVFERAAKNAGFTGFGYYRRNNFIHIDTARARTWGARWFSPISSEQMSRTLGRLPAEMPLQPEKASEDRTLVGTGVAGGGFLTGAGAVMREATSLSSTAQIVAIVGGIVVVAALLYIFRDRIRNLAR